MAESCPVINCYIHQKILYIILFGGYFPTILKTLSWSHIPAFPKTKAAKTHPQERPWHFPERTVLTLDCMPTLGPKQSHWRYHIICRYWRTTTCTLYRKHFSLFKIIFTLLPLHHHLTQSTSFYRRQNWPDRCCLLASDQWGGGAGSGRTHSSALCPPNPEPLGHGQNHTWGPSFSFLTTRSTWEPWSKGKFWN